MGWLNKRRRELLKKVILATRVNGDLLRYASNRIRKMLLNKEKNTRVAHPTNAMIELGNVCNLHCLMCPREYQYGKEMDKGFMPLDRACAIIDQLYPYLDSIGLTGLGETLLYPHLTNVVKYIKHKKKSIIITISTNAHLRDYKQRIEAILPYVDNIQFSVDGVGPVYETIRPNTSFAEVKDNIRFTMEKGKGITFMINCVAMRENYLDMKNVVAFAHEMGIAYVNFNCVSITARPELDRSFYEFFRSAEYRETISEIKALSYDYPNLEITGADIPAEGTFHDCIFPWEYPYITWDGYYVPCCAKPFPKLLNFGNVFEQPVMDVLNSEKAQKFRQAWQRNVTPAFCHNCQLAGNPTR